jgi:hypothetical protein
MELPEDDKLDTSKLTSLARDNAFALHDTADWLHRRVERITSTERRMVRWQFSVDFSLPRRRAQLDGPGFKPYRDDLGDDRKIYYVPIAVLQKWPPLMNFSIRDEHGNPLSLLTSQRNRLIDAEAVVGLAPQGELLDALAAQLRAVATSPPHQSRDIFRDITDEILRAFSSLTPEERASWRPVVRLASILVSNSVLWARITGFGWERFIVKCSCDQPHQRELVVSRRILVAFSWSASRTFYHLPNIGERGSYHLEVRPPPGLEVTHAELRLTEEPPAPWQRRVVVDRPLATRFIEVLSVAGSRLAGAARLRYRALFGSVRPGEAAGDAPNMIQPPPGVPYRRVEREAAYMYVSGLHDNYGVATVYMAPERSGLITGALAMATAIAAMLTVFFAAGVHIAHDVSPAVTTLLLVPGVLGVVVIRAGEHPTVRVHLAGVRTLLMTAGALPVAAAIALLAAGEQARWWWLGFAVIAWLIAGLLAASWLLPNVGER